MANRSQMLTLLLPGEEASRELCHSVVKYSGSIMSLIPERRPLFSSEFVADILVFVEHSVLN